MKKNKLIGAIAISAMMSLSGCNVIIVDSCVHEWSTWEIIDEPTCIDKGARMRYCDLCGRTQSRSMPIDAMYGHRYVENPDGDYAATCTTNGVTGSQICLRCGQKKRGTTTELVGHSWEKNTQATGEQYHEAKCTTPGLYQKKCKNCDATEDEVIQPLGHSEGSVDKGSGILGVIKCKRADCGEVLAYELDVTDATGFNTPNTKMNAKSGSTSMSMWDISSYVGNVLEEGYYDVQLEAAMTDSSHAQRKMYNMAIPALQVDDDASVNSASGNNADKTTESEYRYCLQINASENYNPTTKKSFGELGLGTGISSFRYMEFVSGVQIDASTQTISLRHGNIGYSLFCRSIRLIPHTHELETLRIPGEDGKVTYTLDKCDCGYRRITINATDGVISGGKQNAGTNGYLKLPAINDSITYKFGLTENITGNVYVVGRQDLTKMDQSPYNCDWDLANDYENGEIAISDASKLSNQLLGTTGNDMAGYSDEGKVLIGKATLKEDTTFGDNQLTYKRLDDNNLIISKIVFEGRPVGHIHNYVRYPAHDVEASCRNNKKECYRCTCELEDLKEVPNSKSSHQYDKDEIKTVADCYNFGEIQHTCSVCNQASWREYLPKGHTLGESTNSSYGYTYKSCTACEYGGEASWDLTQSMIQESADGTTWAASTATPLTGKMSNGTTDMSVFKFDNTSYKKVTLTFNNEGDEGEAVLRILATTQVGTNLDQTQLYRQTIGEDASTMRFNLLVNGTKVSFGSAYNNLTMKEIGLADTASKVSDGGFLADAMWLNFFKISLSEGVNTIVLETANLVGHNIYIGGFQLAY